VKQRANVRRRVILGAVAALGVALFVSGCQSAPPQDPTAISVTVYDQNLSQPSLSYYIIARVFADAPSWIVIYNSEKGAPGTIIGKEHVEAGVGRDIRVYVEPNKRTNTIWVKLHADAGKYKEFEYPGVDEPIVVEDKEVMAKFQDLSLSSTKRY
jgi:hypothetical protein